MMQNRASNTLAVRTKYANTQHAPPFISLKRAAKTPSIMLLTLRGPHWCVAHSNGCDDTR